jgi:hypothetical protein
VLPFSHQLKLSYVGQVDDSVSEADNVYSLDESRREIR